MKTKKQDEKVEQKSVLRSAMISPAPGSPQYDAITRGESRGIPAWASVMLLIVGGAVLVFALVRLVKFSWFF